MRANPKLDIETAITELAVGEALVSLLDEKGRPSVTERVFVLPPGSQIGPITPERAQGADRRLAGRRRLREDGRPRVGLREAQGPRGRERAADGGQRAAAPRTRHAPAARPRRADDGGMLGGLKDVLFGSTGPRGGKREGLAEAAARSAVRSIGSTRRPRDHPRRARLDPRRRQAPLARRRTLTSSSYRAVGHRARRRRRDRVFLPADLHQACLRLCPRPGHAALRCGWSCRCRSSWPRRAGSGATGRRVSRRDGWAIVFLGFLGYYFSSFVDFLGLQYIWAGLGRPDPLPLPDAGGRAVVACSLRKRPAPRELARWPSPTPASRSCCPSQIGGQAEGRLFLLGAALVFAARRRLRRLPRCRHRGHQARRVDAVYRVRASGRDVPASRSSSRSGRSPRSTSRGRCVVTRSRWRSSRPCADRAAGFMTAEALKRIGANQFAIIGALGPVSTIFSGSSGWMSG